MAKTIDPKKNFFDPFFLFVLVVAVSLAVFVSGCGGEEKEGSADREAAGVEEPAEEAQITEEVARVSAAGAAGGVVRGAPLIAFSVKTFDGAVVNVEDLRGSPLVINFWASWCGPCKLEAPEIEAAYRAFKDRGVSFLGVAIQDKEARSRAFVEKFKLTYPNGIDSTGEIGENYSVFGIPMTVVVDRGGRFSFVHVGVITEEILTGEIERVL